MSDSERRSNRWSILLRMLVGGLAAVLVAAWIASYFYSFGVEYDQRGDFDRRVASRARGVSCAYGTLHCYSEWADPPDLLDNSLLTINSQLMNLSNGFSAGIRPVDPSTPPAKFLGFSYGSGTDVAGPYGTHSGMTQWQFPIALLAVPACLPLALRVRRFLRRRREATRGFAVLLDGQDQAGSK